MFEKDLRVGELLACYGVLLSDRHRTLLALYYNEDLSLAEIAAEIGISRQGVREGICKAKEELSFFESHLHLLAREEKVISVCKKLQALAGENEEIKSLAAELLETAHEA